MSDINWGRVALGAATGLAASLLAFAVLGLVGLRNSGAGTGVLIFLLYAAFLVAGWVAGRFAITAAVLHGGLAGLLLFVATSMFSLSTGTSLGIVTFLFAGVLSATLGSAGAALAEWRRREEG